MKYQNQNSLFFTKQMACMLATYQFGQGRVEGTEAIPIQLPVTRTSYRYQSSVFQLSVGLGNIIEEHLNTGMMHWLYAFAMRMVKQCSYQVF